MLPFIYNTRIKHQWKSVLVDVKSIGKKKKQNKKNSRSMLSNVSRCRNEGRCIWFGPYWQKTPAKFWDALVFNLFIDAHCSCKKRIDPHFKNTWSHIVSNNQKTEPAVLRLWKIAGCPHSFQKHWNQIPFAIDVSPKRIVKPHLLSSLYLTLTQANAKITFKHFQLLNSGNQVVKEMSRVKNPRFWYIYVEHD